MAMAPLTPRHRVTQAGTGISVPRIASRVRFYFQSRGAPRAANDGANTKAQMPPAGLDQGEVLVRREGHRVILETADEWPD